MGARYTVQRCTKYRHTSLVKSLDFINDFHYSQNNANFVVRILDLTNMQNLPYRY
jgi:hypothetical protein